MPFECHLGPLPVFGGTRVRGRTVYHSSAIWDHPRVLVGYVLEAEMFAIRVPSGTTPVFGGARVRGRTVYHSSAIWDHPRYLVGHVLEAELLSIREHLGPPPVFGGVLLPIFLVFCVMLFWVVCVRPVSCVPNVANFSVWSILDLSLRFSLMFIYLSDMFRKPTTIRSNIQEQNKKCATIV